MKPSKNDLLPYINDLPGAAEAFNVSERTIRRWLESYKLYDPTPSYGPGKLDEDTAKEIRSMYDTDKYTQSELAEMYGVTQPTIGKIVNNISYRVIDLHFGSHAEVKLNLVYKDNYAHGDKE